MVRVLCLCKTDNGISALDKIYVHCFPEFFPNVHCT